MGHSYRDLIVWRRAIDLVKLVYCATATFPKVEIYALTSQIRRSAISVPSDIAEGQGRLTRKEFRHFLGQARGSLLELETQLIIAKELGYLDKETMTSLGACSDEVSRLLHGLIGSMSDSEDGDTGNRKLEPQNSRP